MISALRGIITKDDLGEVQVDVNGVGYRVRVSPATWEHLEAGREAVVWISTYVREDRFELFGFTDRITRTLFEELIERQGIGPKLGLELCSVPKSLLKQAMDEDDCTLLTDIKGIGRKTAEKLLIELKSLQEKHPGMFVVAGAPQLAPYDADAIAALVQLGYNRADILSALGQLPKDAASTEQRVAAALRSL